MDDLAKNHYRMQFKLKCYETAGGDFQTFFDGIMEARYPDDYQKIKPWGPAGDRKNDGYLRSAKTLFQCYGPKNMSPQTTAKKIEDDFGGALVFWGPDYFATWTFVHNSMDGLPPHAEKALSDLRSANEGSIQIDQWGPPRLEQILFELDRAEIVALLGSAPSADAMGQLGMDDIAPLISEVGGLPADPNADLRPVPAEKLTYNSFTREAEELMRFGMRKVPLVERYFKRNQDATLRDRVAMAFAQRYDDLRSRSLTADRTFTTLVNEAAGSERGDSRRESGAYAVVAYFFEFCDIFERPEGTGDPA